MRPRKFGAYARPPARPPVQTLGEGEWSPKAARPGVGGENRLRDGEQMNAISTYPYLRT